MRVSKKNILAAASLPATLQILPCNRNSSAGNTAKHKGAQTNQNMEQSNGTGAPAVLEILIVSISASIRVEFQLPADRVMK